MGAQVAGRSGFKEFVLQHVSVAWPLLGLCHKLDVLFYLRSSTTKQSTQYSCNIIHSGLLGRCSALTK